MLMEKAMQLLEELPCLGDVHLHLLRGQDLDALAHELMDGYRVGLGVVLEVRPPFRRIAELPRSLVEKAWSLGEPVLKRIAPWLLEHYGDAGRMHVETMVFLSRLGPVPRRGHSGPGARLLVYADPVLGPEAGRRAAEALSEGARGFKVISTIHMARLDDPSVGEVFEEASARGVPVLVHAGCDPGIWELPAFCSLGNPSRLEKWLQEYPEVPVVIAHAGGYSAAAPGVFTEEAVALARRHRQVYLDTSAVPLTVLEVVAKALPPGKLLNGSDYPVVEEDDPGKAAARTVAALLLAGRGRRDIEAVMYRNLEELLGEECRPAPA